MLMMYLATDATASTAAGEISIDEGVSGFG